MCAHVCVCGGVKMDSYCDNNMASFFSQLDEDIQNIDSMLAAIGTLFFAESNTKPSYTLAHFFHHAKT